MQKITNLIQKNYQGCKKKPVSFEVFGDEYKGMKEASIKNKYLGKNIFVKVPVVNSKGKFMSKNY